MTKVLVTGATGFLGTNITLNLLERGYEVKAFGLPSSTTKYIEKDGVEIVFGDVADPTSMKRAVEGVEIIIHSAGDTSFWKKRFERQRRTNVDGVRNIMQAALEAKVKRVIHTATVDTLGYNPDGLADENWMVYNYANTGYNHDIPLVIYRDTGQTYDSIRQFSVKDADAYLKFCEYSEQTLAPVGIGMFSAPPGFGAMMSLLDASEGGRQYMKVLLSSVQDIAEEWFESKQMRVAFGRWASEEMIGPREKGTGLYVGSWPLFHTWGFGLPIGGSGALSEALAACIRDNGGTIKLSSTVKRVKVEAGAATGVILDSGEEIKAKKAVVSNVNVKQLFLTMVEADELPSGLQAEVRRLKHSTFAPLVQAIALNEAPKFKAGGDVNKAGFVEISPYCPELLRIYDDYAYGVPNAGMPIMGMSTLYDPSRAPEGKHTLYLYHYEPYSLREGGAEAWDKMKQEVADEVLETARKHTTNLGESNILGRWIASPLDYERMNPALISGDIGHIGSFLTQSFGNRPLPGWGQYKTPVEHLYMSGVSTHPGVGINGGGRATARQIMEDLGIDFKKVMAK